MEFGDCTSNSNTEYASNNDDDFSDINLERVHFNFSLGPILLIYIGQSFVCLRSVLYSRIGLRVFKVKFSIIFGNSYATPIFQSQV